MFWSKRDMGRHGEELAVAFLKRNGYKIVARNLAASGGEIDIVAVEKETDTLCFVEVKYRTEAEHALPVEAVTRGKKARILRAAKAYLKAHRAFGARFRFDIVSVLERQSAPPEIELYRNSFVPSRSGWTGGCPDRL
jgi:putative endonuclease